MRQSLGSVCSAFACLLLLAACVPRFQEVGPPVRSPQLAADRLIMPDGAVLPLRRWLPAADPQAVILALHGMNDYSNAFSDTAAFWARQGIATYAYDQRGFGAAPQPGRWPGVRQLIEDLDTATALVRQRHPNAPLYLLGESMGGAVLMAAAVSPRPPAVDGYILAAPAVWGRAMQGPLQNVALWLTAHTMPWLRLTAEGLEIQPSDNLEMLRALSRDPLVIKATRVDAIYGLVDLMDAAYDAAPRFRGHALIMYGSNEQVIPPEAALAGLRRLPAAPPEQRRIAVYPRGYHMLLRDLHAEVVRRDVVAWIRDPAAPLPSGADRIAAQILRSGAEDLVPPGVRPVPVIAPEMFTPVPRLRKE